MELSLSSSAVLRMALVPDSASGESLFEAFESAASQFVASAPEALLEGLTEYPSAVASLLRRPMRKSLMTRNWMMTMMSSSLSLVGSMGVWFQLAVAAALAEVLLRIPLAAAAEVRRGQEAEGVVVPSLAPASALGLARELRWRLAQRSV